MLKKALIYLGLGPDEEYEQYADSGEPVDVVRPIGNVPGSRPSGTVRAVASATPGGRPPVRPLGSPPRPEAVAPDPPRPIGRQANSAIRIVESAVVKPHASSPTSFNEAQDIGDRFKSGQPVIINLQGVDRDLRRRMIDFSSGLCYALGGKMDKVATHVYMLSPADVEVSAADARSALD